MPTSPHLVDVASKLLNKKAGGGSGPDVSSAILLLDENSIPSVPSRRRSVSSEHADVLKLGTLAKNAPPSMVFDAFRLSRTPNDSMPALSDELVQKGWVQEIDTKSGKPYFFHRKSGDIQFDLPPSRESFLDSMSSSSTRDSGSTTFQGNFQGNNPTTIRRQSFSSMPSDSSSDRDEGVWPHWGRVGNTEENHRSHREDTEQTSPLSSMSSGAASRDPFSSIPGSDPYSPKEDSPSSSIAPRLPPRDVSLRKSAPPSPFDSDSSRLPPPRQSPGNHPKRPTSLPLK
jgi:hypothetical protein